MRDEGDYLSYDETLSIVRRYENSLLQNQNPFFDAIEFEGIIDYYMAENNGAKASEAVSIALKMYPNSSEILLRKADMNVMMQNYEEAFTTLRFLEGVESRNFEVYLIKGQAFLETGQLHLAEEAFDTAVELSIEDKVDTLTRISTPLLDMDEINLGCKYLVKAFAIEPDNLFVLFDLGFCYERMNDLDRSIFFYNRYLDINPFAASVWYNIAIVHTKKGHFDKALDAYDFCLAIDPEYESALHNKANTLATLERFPEALEAFQELVQYEKENVRVWCSLGECYEKQEIFDKAMECYRKAISLDPNHAEAYYGIGVVMMETGQPSLSLDFIQKAISLDPEQYDFWLGLGKVNFEIGQQDEALKAYREAVLINPDEAEAYLALAEIYLYQEKFKEVDTLFDEVGGKFEANASMNVIKAAALYLTKRRKEALDALKAAKKVDPLSVDDFFSIVSIINDDEFILQAKQL
ncbi:MAG: tetratricopeptide repeat protein [Tenuifilaceae bacterium]|jgi:tetratricopeptide (TPR) repeat protein|nr:tetratricopeptide repeat protein [Tenuifilaceae bacterium]